MKLTSSSHPTPPRWAAVRALPPVVRVLALGRFVTSVSAFMMLFLVLYLTESRGLPVEQAGAIAGALGAGMLLGNLTGGRIGDRFGHRRTLLAASTVVGVGTVAVPWLPTWALAVALPVVSYLGATSAVSQGALAALAVPVGERRTSVAVTRAASNAGFVLGPPLGALLVAHSWTALFVIDGLATLVVRALTARKLPAEVSRPAAPPDGGGLWRSLRTNRALLLLLPGIVLVDVVYRQLYTTLPVYLSDQGQPVALYAVLIALGSGLILCLEIPVAVLLSHRPALPVVAAGYALVGAGFGVVGAGLAGSDALGWSVAAGAVAGMVVLTAGEILYKTTATAHVLDEAPPHLVGQYQGLYTGAATSGTMLAGPIGGLVYAWSPAALWPLCGVTALAAAGLALASSRLSPAGLDAAAPSYDGVQV